MRDAHWKIKGGDIAECFATVELYFEYGHTTGVRSTCYPV